MYIIKQHYEATEANKNFAGKITDYYTGKGGTIFSENKLPYKTAVDWYGYKTLAAAKRGLKAAQESAEWETACGYWIVSVSLIEA